VIALSVIRGIRTGWSAKTLLIRCNRPQRGAEEQGTRMTNLPSESEAAYHLLLDADEVPVAASALRLLIADEAHQPEIRSLARAVLDRLPAEPDQQSILRVALSSQELKITHTAVRLLLDDLQREQHDERAVLWQILDKLPDEHAIRAIELE
jgi:hypothetical protein